MGKKEKLSIKDLKRPDAVISFTSRIVDWAVKYNKAIIGSITAVILIFALFSLAKYYLKQQEKKAEEAYYSVYSEYEKFVKAEDKAKEDPAKLTEQQNKTISKLDEVYAKYSGQTSGKLAILNKGHLLFENGKYEEAVKAYEQFLSDINKKDLFYNLTLDSIAHCYEELNNPDKALDYYEKITSSNFDFLKDLAYFNLGRLYETKNNKELAVKNYKKIKDSYPESKVVAKATERLTSLEN